LALAATSLPSADPGAQEPIVRHRGAILIQVVDTAINPLPAEIVLPAFEVSARVNDDGMVFLVNVPDGLYLIQARHLGHRPEWRFARVTGDTSRLEIVLAPAHARPGLRPALPESRLRDFLRRTGAIPLGSFFTRSEIDRHRPSSLVALLDRAANVYVDRPASGPATVRSERAPVAECGSGMLVFVDAVLSASQHVPIGVGAEDDESGLLRALHLERLGLPARWEGSRGPGTSAFDVSNDPSTRSGARSIGARRLVSLLERLPMSRVAAVEVYPTLAGVPPEFRVAGVECGAVLVWTR